MKNVSFILFALVILGCGSKKAKVLPFDTEITSANAKEVTAFENTPESVVMYFYASLIRDDNDWQKVCPAEEKQTKMFRGKMGDEYSQWTFNKYRFVKKEEFQKDRYYVTIYMSISINGKEDDGEDQVTVERIGDKWMVTDVPS